MTSTVVDVSAGRLVARLTDCDLRRVELDGVELIRRIGFAVRDDSWNTLVPEVDVETVSVDEGSFRARFRLSFNSKAVGFGVTIHIEGHPDDSLTYSFTGTAERPFSYNRIGLVLLHPPSLEGRRVVTSAHGVEHYAALPIVVEPQWRINGRPRGVWTPFDKLAIEIGPGVSLDHHFEGDVFEIEDHRNWGDASYKTYSTPLTGDWPYQLGQGASLSQTVAIRLKRGERKLGPTRVFQRAMSVSSESAASIPDIGFLFEATPALDAPMVDSLRQLRLDHVRTSGHEVSPAVASIADKLQASVELVTTTDEADRPSAAQHRVTRILLVNSDDGAAPTTSDFDPAFGGIGSGCSCYMATTGGFVSINRIRPLPGGDGVGFPLSPQVHDSDALTLIENLEAIEAMVDTARRLGGGEGVSIGPITLTPVPQGFPPRLSERPDDPYGREPTRFWLSWSLGCLVAAIRAGVTATTWGPIEAMLRREPSSGSIQVTPHYQLFNDLRDWSEVTETHFAPSGSTPSVVLALTKPGQHRVLTANLSGRPQRVPIEIGDDAEDVYVTTVVADGWSDISELTQTHQSANTGATIDLELGAYGYTRVDWRSE